MRGESGGRYDLGRRRSTGTKSGASTSNSRNVAALLVAWVPHRSAGSRDDQIRGRDWTSWADRNGIGLAL
jgi:hypothetical protein